MARSRKQHHKPGRDPVYAVEDGATGRYLNIDGDEPRVVRFRYATRTPATLDGRLELGRRLSTAQIVGPYDIVRVDRP